jgi:ArsR family transcriptional regulator
MKTRRLKSFDMELFFRALGDRTRLRLLNLMGDNEVCVCFLVEALKQTQPKISRHLAYLRRAGLVATRREGKWMHYRLSTPTDPDAEKLLATIRTSLKSNPEMQMDRSRLTGLCCSAKLPAPLKRAPKPVHVISLEETGR